MIALVGQHRLDPINRCLDDTLFNPAVSLIHEDLYNFIAAVLGTSNGDKMPPLRLIDTQTIEIVNGLDEREVGRRYAILSHTWGRDEITYADLLKGERRESEGFKKVKEACEVALESGHRFLWVDTCCIDKTSSAELSEAINAMHLWYTESKECIVYLSDVCVESEEANFEDVFRTSRWFTRGWTLQELLEPKNLTFYNRNWVKLGTKIDLQKLVASITGIPEKFLVGGPIVIYLASFAQKMSWASGRETSRPEDRAYCMLGLLSVNMPLLYGEGPAKAFQRLQHEFIRRSGDETIFAWTVPKTSAYWRATKEDRPNFCPNVDMFARSPDFFAQSGNVVVANIFPFAQRRPYVYTNKGLEFEIRRLRSEVDDALSSNQREMTSTGSGPVGTYTVPLNCRLKDKEDSAIVISLRHIPELGFSEFVEREYCDKLESVTLNRPADQTVLTRTVHVMEPKFFMIVGSLPRERYPEQVERQVVLPRGNTVGAKTMINYFYSNL